MLSALKSTAKVLATVAGNLGALHYAVKQNTAHNETYKNMTDTQKNAIQQRNRFMANSMFYNSENPYLRAVAIQAYDEEQAARPAPKL